MKIEGIDANFTLATQTGVSKKDAKPSDPQSKMQLEDKIDRLMKKLKDTEKTSS